MKKTDRRVRKTKAQLRSGLAKLMQSKSINEITVKELVDLVDINRSTFYLHYTDIYNMLEKIETEIFDDVKLAIDTHPIGVKENTFPFIEDIFSILLKNKEICKALIGPHGDISFIHKIESIIAEHSIQALEPIFPNAHDDLKYSFSFCLNGCLGLIKTWLLKDNDDTPGHMAELTYKMVTNAMNVFYQDKTEKV
ncbi:MAG: HTH tetR-type domain-containing protein [Lachnoclostridium sp.]|jgi:AcrR family transcriptional regulator